MASLRRVRQQCKWGRGRLQRVAARAGGALATKRIGGAGVEEIEEQRAGQWWWVELGGWLMEEGGSITLLRAFLAVLRLGGRAVFWVARSWRGCRAAPNARGSRPTQRLT
eukprot:6073431-Pyramimonas_sp.AAC.1